IMQSVLQEDPFGLSSKLIWFDNFIEVFGNPDYLNSLWVTVLFSGSVSLLSLSIGLFLALQADRIVHGAVVYNTMLVWPYAISAAVAGVLWLFLFNPTIGIVAFALARLGYDWNHLLNSGEAMTLVIAASTWNRVPYNFLFFLAGLQSIPKSLVEASAIDGAGRFSRFWKIVFPLLMPTTFFLVVVNVVYAFFETFGVIHQITEGGPARATEILIYKVFYDGVIGLDLGGSAAQSVVLMTIVIALTVIQFRYIESKVNY
ncbi:MAG: ABC transporter permease subunit, partial [SAR324 cluster bacterium]|nr:ABC transporter permease subunit [SAR324 cluster bacterium]